MSELHINRPKNPRYLARVRGPGHRLYVRIGKKTSSVQVAIRRLAAEFSKGGYKRGDVLMASDESWCEPVMVCEVVRR